jgi:hypothetical protein
VHGGSELTASAGGRLQDCSKQKRGHTNFVRICTEKTNTLYQMGRHISIKRFISSLAARTLRPVHSAVSDIPPDRQKGYAISVTAYPFAFA